jgi:hypothetical protein
MFDNPLGLFQLISGHRRKQVMLNLVIESAVQEVSKAIRYHVARGENLPLTDTGTHRLFL